LGSFLVIPKEYTLSRLMARESSWGFLCLCQVQSIFSPVFAKEFVLKFFFCFFLRFVQQILRLVWVKWGFNFCKPFEFATFAYCVEVEFVKHDCWGHEIWSSCSVLLPAVKMLPPLRNYSTRSVYLHFRLKLNYVRFITVVLVYLEFVLVLKAFHIISKNFGWFTCKLSSDLIGTRHY